MATVLSLKPIPPSSTSARPEGRQLLYPVATRGNLCRFIAAEEDMMPADWAEAGNPTPYELRVTIHTCKRLWQLNHDALDHPDCDHERTRENIKVLEKLYIILMDYLVDE